MPRTKPRQKVRYHPVLKLPPLPPDQYSALRQNIAVNGVLVPIIVDSDGRKRGIIDGSHRKKIANELGYDCPEIVQAGLEEEEKRTLARALNLARRQLDRDQKRELIADQLRETPDRSSNWIGKTLGVDDKTVTSVRRELQSTSEFPKLNRTIGEDGKYRPSTYVFNGGSPSNPRSNTSRWRWLRDHAPPISSIISLPHDAFGTEVKVHSEILLFNMSKLAPHYFLPDKYLSSR